MCSIVFVFVVYRCCICLAYPVSDFIRFLLGQYLGLYSALLSCLDYVSTHWFLPARRYASAGNRDRNVSVCPSVTCRYCVKTKKASVMISSPSGSSKTLVS